MSRPDSPRPSAAVSERPDPAAQRILEELNPAQVEAVAHDQGPLLIVAGAGTGKTTVLTRRIAYLIATRLARPEEILALTFTDKAALEMEERVDVLVPYGYADVRIATFHAFGDWLLREHALELGLTPAFRVLNRAEQVLFLRTRLFESGPPDGREAIVFLHGNPGSAGDWIDFVGRTGAFARSVAFDMPGFGKADKPRDFEYSTPGEARFLDAALTASRPD